MPLRKRIQDLLKDAQMRERLCINLLQQTTDAGRRHEADLRRAYWEGKAHAYADVLIDSARLGDELCSLIKNHLLPGDGEI